MLSYQTDLVGPTEAQYIMHTVHMAIQYLQNHMSDQNQQSSSIRGPAVSWQQNGESTEHSLTHQSFFQYFAGVNEDSATEFWQAYLRDSKAQSFPTRSGIAVEATSYPQFDSFDYAIHDLQWNGLDTSPTHLIYLAWSVLTARYTELNEVIFGSPITLRNSSPGKTVQSSMDTVLPVRLILDWQATVKQSLDAVVTVSEDMAKFGRVGIQRIRTITGGEHTAVAFQTVLDVVQFGETSRLALTSKENMDFSLILEFRLEDGGMTLAVLSHKAAIDHGQVKRMAVQFEHILRQICSPQNHGRTLGVIETISNQDLQDIWRWNSTVPEPFDVCVHELIAEVVRLRPNAPAICAWDGDLTYKQLDELSDRLCCQLIELGLNIGQTVPICIEKSMWASVAILAIMKAGGVGLTLDVAQPKARLEDIVKEVRPIIMISSAGNEMLAHGLASDVTIVVASEEHLSRQPPMFSDLKLPIVDPSDALYMVFTSGSTGIPKGVMIEHRNFSSAIKYQQKALRFTPESRVFDFASQAFDLSWYNLLHTLTSGACLCVASDSERRDDVASCLKRYKITYAQLTPTLARVLGRAALSGLDTLVLAGEAVLPTDINLCGPDTHVINVYGPAECTPCSTIGDLKKDGPVIGNGLGLRTWIVDPVDGRTLMPIGVVGELWLEGPLVGQGYVNAPDATVAVFVEDPPWLLHGESSTSGRSGRLYKTGDLVRYDSNGLLTFVGRKDTQVKIRGQRVELSEVEHHVRNALVDEQDTRSAQIIAEVVVPEGSETPTLVVFVSLSGSDRTPITDKDLLDRTVGRMTTGIDSCLSDKVPIYMIPSAYIPIATVPATVTGKTDRRKLRQLGASFTAQQLSDLALSHIKQQKVETVVEKQLQALWSTVLNIDSARIGLNDSFLRLGGDSIGAMKLVAAARNEGLPLSVADIFQNPTIGALSKILEEQQPMDITLDEAVPAFSLLPPPQDEEVVRMQVAALCRVSDDVIEDAFPCTPLQEGLLALTEKHAGDYTATLVFQLPNDVDMARMYTAWSQVVASTPILRTRIVNYPGKGLVQVVLKEEVEWTTADDHGNLNGYLKDPTRLHMGLGVRLSRFGYISGGLSSKQYLVWTIHHALYDGWSLQLLTKAAEKAYFHGSPPTLRPFQPFIKRLGETSHEAYSSFWSDAFSGSEAQQFPQLPSANYHPNPQDTLEYQVKNLNWSGNIFTPQTMLRGALSVVMGRPSDSQDVTFGTILAGRQSSVPGIEEMAGPTISTVPVRVKLDWKSDLKHTLHAIQDQAMHMIPYEQAGLQRISRASSEAEQACRFQTLLVVQPAQDETGRNKLFIPQDEDDLKRDNIHVNLGAYPNYALIIECHLQKNGVTVELSYDPNVIGSVEVRRMAEQFGHVLKQLREKQTENKTLGDIDSVTPQDLKDIWRWNATVPDASAVCAHDCLYEITNLQPQALAICAWDGSLSYAELWKLSSYYALMLVSLGVRPGDVVPLCFEKSMWTPVAMLAVIKASGAFVAIDTTQATSRLQTIVEQIKPSVVLSSTKRRKIASLLGNYSILVVDEEHSQHDITQNAVLPPVDPTSTMYIIFTSGSTGRPKAVILEHQAVVTSCHSYGRVMDLSKDSRVLQFASYAFDACIMEIFSTWLHGGCVCVPSEDDRITDLARTMESMAVNTTLLTPSVARLLDPTKVPTLKTLILGAEAPWESDYERWRGLPKLFNAYGPAECAVIHSVRTWTSSKLPSKTIGRAAGSCSWIVNQKDHTKLVPIGTVGELLVEGPILARGYLNNAESTAQSFVRDPIWLVRGGSGCKGRRGRLYKTGDLVYYNPDGSLVFVARKDTQVKVHGQRVELGDVEHHVEQAFVLGAEHDLAPSTRPQVVAEVIRPQGNSHSILVVFVGQNPSEISVIDEGAWAKTVISMTADIEKRLADRVPYYMVPTTYIPLQNIPTTGTGKINRKRLRELGMELTPQQLSSLTSSSTRLRPVETELQRRLQVLWATVLAVDSNTIGLESNFMRIGGDSISAMQLVGAGRDQGLSFSVADLFRHPRLEEFATIVQTDGAESTGMDAIPAFSLLKSPMTEPLKAEVAGLCSINAVNIEDVLPCTPLQQGLMALTAKRAGDYVATIVRRIPDNIDHKRLHKAWKQVVAATPILRTRLIDLPGHGIVQVVVNEEPDWVTSNDLNLYLEDGRQREMVLGACLSKFAVASTQDSGQYYLVWTIHHALYDGWSMQLILDAIKRAYQAGANNSPMMPFTPMIKHVLDLRDNAVTAFWGKQFAGSESHSFPSLPAASCNPKCTNRFTSSLEKLQWGSNDITASNIIRTAWAILVSGYTGSNDVVFGATVTGRQTPLVGIERVVGPTIATVPVRVVLDPGETLETNLYNVQMQAVDMIPFEQTGLQRISQVSLEASEASRFQTLLVVQPFEKDSKESSLFQATEDTPEDGDSLIEHSSTLTHALVVECCLEATGVRLYFSYDINVVSQAQVHQMSGQLQNLIRQVLAEGNRPKILSSLEVVSAQDLSKIWAWNSTLTDPNTTSVPDLLMNTPHYNTEAPAIDAWDGKLNYSDLDKLSTRLACHLISLGVRADMLVPLCFEKSVWTPVAMLAVIKAGAAVVGMDVTQPETRLQTIVQQTQPVILLSSAANEELARRLGNNCHIVVVSQSSLDLLDSQPQTQLPHIDSSDALCTIFTSGSTGMPKGVVLTHSNFATAIPHHVKAFDLKPTSRIYDFASYAFDFSWSNLLLTLYSGGCICIPSEEERRNDVTQSIQRFNANFAFFTPSVARILGPDALSTLDTLIVGGEALSRTDFLSWLDRIKIISVYGPTECTVMATTLEVLPGQELKNGLGRPIVSTAWVVEPNKGDSLMPIGAVGELWLEGPLVTRGYLNAAEKTSESFVLDPAWLVEGLLGKLGRRGRLYKTGDLVRYNPDGSLTFVGRKDTQIKLRGQRVELDEVEHHVREAIVAKNTGFDIRTGIQLIAEVITPEGSEHPTLVVFIHAGQGSNNSKDIKHVTAGIEEHLSQVAPVYMIPNAYIPLDNIPVTATGKLDRRQLRKLGSTLYHSFFEVNDVTNYLPPSNKLQKSMQEIWADVLNVSQTSISIDAPFTKIGGDSITAMQVVSRCRAKNLSITVGDILRARTIEKLALCCQPVRQERLALHQHVNGRAWTLSPAQQMFFDAHPQGLNHFNQSFILRLMRPTSAAELEMAVNSVVSRHPMLRVRFQQELNGRWQQIVPTDESAESIFTHHDSCSRKEAKIVVDSRQQSLDIVNGPIFTVDLFSIDGEDQAVLLTAHHLIVDLVSWRIIWHDIEKHLQVGLLPSHSSVSFQSWSELQAQASYSLQLSDVLPFPVVPPTDFSFWGMQSSENDFTDCQVYSSLLSEVETTLLLGDSNECFRTEPVDLILGALIHSFGQVFPDRQVPPIFLEGHGREPINDIDANLSETVGWFTTLHPIQISNAHGSLSDTVKFTKDIRRQIPGKGRPYFAYRYQSKESLEKDQAHQAVEIILNYTGKYQQLENPNALFKPEDRAEIADLVDISPAAQRFALVDVSADVDQGRLSITFRFKQQMKHQARLQKWLRIFEQTLKDLVHSLTKKAMEFTLSDFPLLSISYQGLEVLFENRLSALGVDVQSVQDIYPCTAVQEGILLSTRKGAASYANYWVWNCVSSTEDKPSPARLEEAWRTVARKHAILSTILVEHPDTGGFIQVVLGGLRHRVNHLSTAAKNPADVLFEQPRASYFPGEPLHTFTICQGADNSVACRLDINHVLMDAASMQILLDDLARTYHGYQLEEAPSFRDLVQSLGMVAKAERLRYWTRFLDGVSPCIFSSITPLEQASHIGSHNVVNLPLESTAGIEKFCKSHGITRSVFLQVAWALVLWHYTGMREICFGYMASGRDAPIANIHKMIGPLINILISRIDLRLPLDEALAATSEQSIEHLDYQHASLAEIQHELGFGSQQLFNTAITVREGTSSKNRNLGVVEFQEVHSDDPHEVSLQAVYLGISLIGLIKF